MIADFLNARSCTVSLVDPDGVSPSTTIEAETLYEAAVRAVRTFREHGCAPAPASAQMIEVQPPAVVHTITLTKLQQGLKVVQKSPNDRITKERLKQLLAR
jgi:hypothetical protein